VSLDLDLKWVGYEDRVVDALQRHGLVDRTLVSTMETRSLRRVRELDPAIRLGRSVPRLRRNPMDRLITKPFALYVYFHWQSYGLRSIVGELERGEIDAVMAHFGLVSKRFARTILDAGGELYVWTVDDAKRIEALRSLAVTGVVTNDPRLFAPG
jgi:glycerophosphoryl diester phosphodiesterase